ncbi:hypothetical protein [Altibacter lentus]|uniref:hypothetical protein n=1 Tax=Altibacter lentus TaxID=1223410 RepID=UPI00054F0F08|nr:hypothetical protein [Altibacter lentus]
MAIELTFRANAHRRLCIKKDLIELSQWIDTLSSINVELGYLILIDKQLIKDNSITVDLQGLRRKNTLLMGTLCRYEQELNTEYEFGKKEYNVTRAKEHEKKRDVNSAFIQEFTQLKKRMYIKLSKYRWR